MARCIEVQSELQAMLYRPLHVCWMMHIVMTVSNMYIWCCGCMEGLATAICMDGEEAAEAHRETQQPSCGQHPALAGAHVLL